MILPAAMLERAPTLAEQRRLCELMHESVVPGAERYFAVVCVDSRVRARLLRPLELDGQTILEITPAELRWLIARRIGGRAG